MQIGEVLAPCTPGNTISADTGAVNAMALMRRNVSSRFMVLDGDRPVGIATLKGMLHLFAMRVVEPYAYGVDAGGQPILRAYQASGESDSGVPAWKLFRVEEITELNILEDTFESPRAGHMRNDPAMTKIYCEI